jgi:hypothetical protein
MTTINDKSDVTMLRVASVTGPRHLAPVSSKVPTEILRVDSRRKRRRSTTIRRFHVEYHPASICHRCG